MASGTASAAAPATVLRALKTTVAAAVLASMVVVGGATAVADAAGAIQLPRHGTTTHQATTGLRSAQDRRWVDTGGSTCIGCGVKS